MCLRAFLTAGAILAFASISASAGDRRDGNWWQSMPELGRKFYLVGFLDGTTATYTDARRAIEASLDQADCRKKTCYDKLFAFEKLQESSLDNAQRQYDTLEVSQIEEAINTLYADPRNLNIPVLMVELVAIESIRGAGKADLERRLQLYRKRAK
jgi:hypothetical protein